MSYCRTLSPLACFDFKPSSLLFASALPLSLVAMQGNQRQQFHFRLCDFLPQDTTVPAVTVNPRVESSSSFSTQTSLSEAGTLSDQGTCGARSAISLAPSQTSLCSLDTTRHPRDPFPEELLFPTNSELQKQMAEESVGAYLEFCKTNSLAEHWAMLQDQVSYDEKGSVRDGWIARNLKRFRVKVTTWVEGSAHLQVLPDTEKESLHELMNALVIVNGKLGITSRLRCACDSKRDEDDDDDDDDDEEICDGKHASPADCKDSRWFDVKLGARVDELFGSKDKEYHPTQKHCVYSFGNVRAAILSLNAIESIKAHNTNTSGAADCGFCTLRLCEMVANPGARAECALLPLTRIPEARNLNEEQRACLLGLRYSLEAVQGPPGTGKTTFIHTAVQALSAQHPEAVTLVSCVQNQAIENVALRFATTAKTLPFIVLAQQHNDRVGMCSRYWTLDSQVDRDPDVKEEEADYLAKKAHYRANRKRYESGQYPSEDKMRSMLHGTKKLMKEAWRKLQAAKRETRVRLVKSARAVLTTVTSSAHWLSEAARASLTPEVQCVILDEAGYAPDAQMPQLLLYKAQLLLLVGDHKQLPPFARGFAAPPASLLERVFLKLKDQAPTLTRQYRMHPRICNYVSKAFYSSRLITDPSVKHRELNPGQPGLFQGTVLDMYESRRAGAEIREGTSYWNYTEVVKTLLALRHLHSFLPASKTIAVISFYKAQVLHLKDEVADVPSLQALVDSQRLRILSVDACQGSEADVIILNCVRSLPESCGPGRPIPFFANKNRFCVATSRAKHLLLLIGCGATLGQQGRFFEHVKLITSKGTGIPASTAAAWWQILSEKLSMRRLASDELSMRRLASDELSMRRLASDELSMRRLASDEYDRIQREIEEDFM